MVLTQTGTAKSQLIAVLALLNQRAPTSCHMVRCRDGGITKLDLKTLIRQTNNHLGPVALVRPVPCAPPCLNIHIN